jgi:hypothetical protein
MRHPYPVRTQVVPLGHNQQLLALLSNAIRAASMAPSDREAFNVAGDALIRATELVKADVNRRSEDIFAC